MTTEIIFKSKKEKVLDRGPIVFFNVKTTTAFSPWLGDTQKV